MRTSDTIWIGRGGRGKKINCIKDKGMEKDFYFVYMNSEEKVLYQFYLDTRWWLISSDVTRVHAEKQPSG